MERNRVSCPLGTDTSKRPLLDVRDLRTYFFTHNGVVKAVDGVSFTLHEGKTLGLVGESGCGKTITCLSILNLVPEPAGRIVSGSISFAGEELLSKSGREMRQIRGRQISMILQDPNTSLNPVFTVGQQLGEVIRIRQGKQQVREKLEDMLQLVRIPVPKVMIRNYPHQISGGMRQRVAGAIALSCQPLLLIADEPTTSLDVTIQAQYLRLLKDLQRQFNLAIIFITHDFGIVAKVCDRVAVMYAGKIVEEAPVRELFNKPRHPYTIGLMNSLPSLEVEVSQLSTIEGQPPILLELPPGCLFAPRCSVSQPRCLEVYPPPVAIDDEHWVSCWQVVNGNG